MMTRKVGTAERKAVLKLTEVYKRFGEQRRELTALHQQIQDWLDDYEKAIVHQSRKPLGLLPRKAPLPAKNQSSLQTRRLGHNQRRRKSFSP